MDSYQKLIVDKAKKKRQFMGTMFFPRNPVLFCDFSHDKKNTDYTDLISGLEAIKLNTLVLLPGKTKKSGPHTFVHFITPDQKTAALIAADFVFSPHTKVVHEAWEKGCVPITLQDGEKTVGYNPLKEKGNGFYFNSATKWEIFATIVRALETYQFPFDWENLIREIVGNKRKLN